MNTPQTITCHVLSSDTLKSLSASSFHRDDVEPLKKVEKYASWPVPEGLEVNGEKEHFSSDNQCVKSSLVLAGLHACGDLSVTMLRSMLYFMLRVFSSVNLCCGA